MNRRNLNGAYVTLDSIHQTIDDGYRYDIDGIFLDEGDTLQALDFYAALHDYIKNRTGVRDTFEILNAPGYQTRSDVIDLADVVIKSEQSWSSTLSQRWATFTRAWPAEKVGVIVVGVPNDEASGLLALRLTRQFGAGWIYLTDLFDSRGTHYSFLPHEPLWSVEVGATEP